MTGERTEGEEGVASGWIAALLKAAAVLAGACVHHRSVRQLRIATSTAGAEYVAAFDAGRSALHLRRQLATLGLPQTAPTALLEDNMACIKMASAPASAPTQKTQHLDGKFHWLRQQVVHEKSLKLVYIPTAQQAADFLTKACPRVLVRRFLHALDGSAPDIVDSSVLSGSAPAGAVGTALHGPSPFVTNQLTNIKPTRTPLSTHLHL